MKTTITVTSKGQTTLPVAIRRHLGVGSSGGVLRASFDEHNKQLLISKPIDIEKFSNRISKYIKVGSTPVLNVDDYYQEHRKL
ncbi:MAG: type II toxin-antitoxin system PrlF family antitoxin [Candidatus Berkelbacteria bacterium]|nr:type II toxin-antitoxin system PrlF family antitoxin [Candidatus Berkelbacteria bacterium]